MLSSQDRELPSRAKRGKAFTDRLSYVSAWHDRDRLHRPREEFGDPPTEGFVPISVRSEEGDSWPFPAAPDGQIDAPVRHVRDDNPTAGEVRLLGRTSTRSTKEALRFRNLSMGSFSSSTSSFRADGARQYPDASAGNSEWRKRSAPAPSIFLAGFELEHCNGKYPSQRSGGELQRVAVIARALSWSRTSSSPTSPRATSIRQRREGAFRSS